MSNGAMFEEQRRAALQVQQTPLISGLAGYIRDCFDAAKDAREELDVRMLKCMRQRLGQYDPDMLAQLTRQGGAQIYMLLTQTKCRGAEAWLRDILLSTGMIPWDLSPTPVPDLSPSEMKQIMAKIGEHVSSLVQSTGIVPTQAQLEELKLLAVARIKAQRLDTAVRKTESMKQIMADQLVEGNMVVAVDQFISDLTTFPYAVMKGPVVTQKAYLSWGTDMRTGKVTPQQDMKFTPWFDRTSPFDFYWEPGITDIQSGYTLEKHELSRRDVAAMLGQDGYDESSVRLVLHDYENGMLNDWLDMEYDVWERRRLEGKGGMYLITSPAPTFKALEFNGSVSGRMLQDWGMDTIDDPDQEFEVNAWLIGRHVIRAVMNADPLLEKPYRVTAFNKVPGSVAGIALPELIADTQAVCNAAARALVNNMSVASGPQVEISVDRLPSNEEITEVSPWKIWQVLSDPLGSSNPAVRFNQPSDNSQSLMQIFERFSRQADEQSGIPAYTYGDTDIQGAGRTASGLSMLMGSAGKGIRQIVTHIDLDVFQPMLRYLYRWNMKYHPDDSVKGDSDVVAKGTASLVKEQLNMRRVEFLQATANPIDAEIVGPKGRAAILREVAKGLEMDVDKIIPSEAELDLMQEFQRKMQMMQAQAPEENIEMQRDESGAVTGAKVTSGRPPAAQMDQGARVPQ